jgi:hypothetical protein
MKKLRFISGFVLGSLIFGVAGVYAGTGGNVIKVFYSIKDIKINKVSKMPKDNNDKPFVYNGSTYVPLRFVAESLGQPVKWDGKNQTVLIGETEKPTDIYPGRDVKHMKAQGGYFSRFNYQYDSKDKIEDNVGNQYSNYITFEFPRYDNGSDSRWVDLQFPLNSQIKRLKGKVGLTGKYRETYANISFKVLADDQEVYTATFKPGDFPKELNIDLTNAMKVEFKVSADKEFSELGLFDVHFEK